MIHDFKLDEKVYHPVDQAPFKVVGVRADQVEIFGDWSGGTHPHIACAADWVKPSEISRQPYERKFEHLR
jgi:hypothetical protein